MEFDAEAIAGNEKVYVPGPSWVEGDNGYLSLVAPLEIEGVTIEGLVLRATAYKDLPDKSKSFPEQVLANILPKSSTDDLLRRTPVMSPPSPSSAGWALVTGASSGIGRALATQLAASKHDIVAVARNATRLEALAGELRREWDVRVRVISINLADPDAAPVPGVSTWGGGRPPLLSRTTTTGRRHEHSNPT